MRLFAFFLMAAFALVALFAKPALGDRAQSSILFADPWLLRALSGFGRNVTGDYIWLKSRQVDETGSGDRVDDAALMRVAQAHATLDPFFATPVLYAAGYLASVPKRPVDALALIAYAQKLNPDRFDLLMGEAMIRITHEVPNSADRLVVLASKIEPLPEKTKVLGAIKVDDWLTEAIVYVRTKEGKKALLEADLRQLLRQTTHPVRRAKILETLQKLSPPEEAPQSAQAPL